MEKRFSVKYVDDNIIKAQYNVTKESVTAFIKSIPIEKRDKIKIVDLSGEREEDLER